MKEFFKDLKKSIKDLVVYEYKYLTILFLIAIICYLPVNYYIVVGGGISDIGSRVNVENGYKSDGSLNISYVSTTDGVLLTYALSYIMPNWSRDSVSDYKFSEEETEKEIMFRNDLLLDIASSAATYNAYKQANRHIELVSKKYYVISSSEECNIKVGDEILEIDDNKIDGFDYSEYISSLNVGDTIKVKVIRDKKEKTIETKIHELEGRKVMGIYLQTIEEFDTDPKVKIKFKSSETGPSGGLMTTLSIYNQLVKEDITKGLTIAGTGTIDYEGNVGEIGGVEYKLRGAVVGKADVFIVPDGDNYKEVTKIVKKEKLNIKIIKAKTFEQVLKELEELK